MICGTPEKANRQNNCGCRAKNATIAAAAGTARSALRSRKPICYEILNISLYVCTFDVHLEL